MCGNQRLTPSPVTTYWGPWGGGGCLMLSGGSRRSNGTCKKKKNVQLITQCFEILSLSEMFRSFLCRYTRDETFKASLCTQAVLRPAPSLVSRKGKESELGFLFLSMKLPLRPNSWRSLPQQVQFSLELRGQQKTPETETMKPPGFPEETGPPQTFLKRVIHRPNYKSGKWSPGK